MTLLLKITESFVIQVVTQIFVYSIWAHMCVFRCVCVSVCVFTPAFEFLTAHLAYANGVYSCRAAGLNEKPLAGDQYYWSAWTTALSRANWSITTGCFRLMENDWCFPQDIITPRARGLSECTGMCVRYKHLHNNVFMCISVYECWAENSTRIPHKCVEYYLLWKLLK